MVDVARLAGVSHQTVSRVLNNHPNVRLETARRVRAAIAELGYRPNRAARALVTGRSQLLGVVALNTTPLRPGVAAHGVRAGRRGGGVRGERRQRRSAWTARRSARSSSGTSTSGWPGIVVDRPGGLGRRGARRPDRRRPAGDHRRRPERDRPRGSRSTRWPARAWPPGTCSTPGTDGLARLRPAGVVRQPRAASRGWEQTLREAGAEVPPVLPADWSAASGYRVGQMLARIPEVTAVFAANDHLALGILRALHERGRRVPDDLSVVGFDDVPEAGYFIPPLTTVRPDFHAVARACAGARSSSRSRPAMPGKQQIDARRPPLVVAHSVAPPPH